MAPNSLMGSSNAKEGSKRGSLRLDLDQSFFQLGGSARINEK
jgi:hypothetical protein